MIPVADALREILARARQLGAEPAPLAACLDRVLRTAACTDLDSPPFDASAMDGYALNIGGARPPDGLGNEPRVKTRPEAGFHPAVSFHLIGESAAGSAFAGTVGPGQCVRIFTGAPVPAGADWVVKQEDTNRDGEMVRVSALGPGHIRRRGENRRAGEVVVAAGTRLGPAELAALASAGITAPSVTRRPRCVHIVTGDELVAPDQVPAGAQIRDSNSALIAALLARHGADLVGHAHVRDNLAAAQAAVAGLPAHDVLLISGGASVGDHDFARPLLSTLGYALHFQQVNLRPGKPLVFASQGDRLAFALPGNPVSHWVTFHLFVAPLLEKFATGLDAYPKQLRGRLVAGSALPPRDSRQTIWPARVAVVEGQYELTLLTLASSGDGSGLVGANALVPLPANGLDPERPVDFISCP